MIYQNDQYYLQVKVKQAGNLVTSDMCDEMIVKLGNVTKKKSTGELVFSANYDSWLFPLTYEQTSNGVYFNRTVPMQAWFSDLSGNYYDTNVVNLKVNTSIINKNDIGEI